MMVLQPPEAKQNLKQEEQAFFIDYFLHWE